MAKEVKQSIEELTAWVNESKGTRGVIILAAENIKINEGGATEGDASICVAGRGDLLCHLYEIGITAKDDNNNPLRLIHRRVMRKLDLRKVITALADAGFVYAISNDAPSATDAYFGSRLCFKNRDLALYAGKQFASLWLDFCYLPNTECKSYFNE